jgi:hypothetical protein
MATQQDNEAIREHREQRDVLNLFFFPDMARTDDGLLQIRIHVRYLTREHALHATTAAEYAQGDLLAHHSNDARRRDHYQEMINLLVLQLLALRYQV